jgi:regulatory protein
VAADLRTITEIRGMRGSPRRTIYLDGEVWRTVASPVLRELGLAPGAVVEPDDLDSRALSLEPTAARARAYRLLTYRDRSAAELTSKLLADGYPESVVSELVADLMRTGLVDDDRFAESLAASLISVRGFGRARALREMARKGIPDELAVKVLDELAPEHIEHDRARAAAERLVRPGDSVDRLAARLVRRGFSFTDALDAAVAALADPSFRPDSADPF